MNKEAILSFAKYLDEQVSDRNFHMCSNCVMQHATEFFGVDMFYPDTHYDNKLDYPLTTYHPAADKMGLTLDQANIIAYDTPEPYRVSWEKATKDDAVAMLRNLVETGEIIWPERCREKAA